MIRRLFAVLGVLPTMTLGIILNIVWVITSVIWGPIYYIITGEDPITEERFTLFIDISTKISDWILKKFNLEDKFYY